MSKLIISPTSDAPLVLTKHLLVVRAELQEHLLVSAQKRSRINPSFVPDQHDPAARLQYPGEFVARQFLIEPMKRLPGRDKIDAIIRQSCGFCGAFDACEFRI